DPDGAQWRFNPDLSEDVTEICDALAQSVQKQLWKQVSLHSEGACLKGGGDLTMLQLNVKRMHKKDMYQEAGALEGIACATIWNGDRQKRAGYQTDGLCT
ncbi:unnamed protein product, partial [Prorocentrum cordatum]